MEKVVLTRNELYDMLWAEPVSSLVKRYNITHSGLKIICRDMAIPLPDNGHWQKLKFGKEVPTHPLPSDYKGEQQVIFILKQEGDKDNLNLLSPASVRQKEIENDNRLSLAVPGRLINPDKLIVAAQNDLADQKHLHRGLTITYRGTLNIRVSPDNVGRALRFIDALVKNLRFRGHRVHVEHDCSCVVIQGEKIKFGLREKVKRKEAHDKSSLEQYEYNPTGILIFSIEERYNNCEWSDGKLPLEKQLSKIIAGLEIKAKDEQEKSLRIKKYWEERKNEKNIEKELEQQKQKEITEFKKLLNDANRWRQAKILRDYINAIEEKVIAENSIDVELKSWLAWARKKADWYESCIRRDDEVLKEFEEK